MKLGAVALRILFAKATALLSYKTYYHSPSFAQTISNVTLNTAL